MSLPDQGKNIPGYGTMAGMLPTWAVSSEGKSLRQKMAKLFNVELKDRSGAAVIDSELERLKGEFGSGRWNDEQQLREGVTNYVRRLKEIANNVVSGSDPEAVEEYQRRGGRNMRQSFDGLFSTATKKSATNQKPSSGLTPEEEEEFRILDAKYGRGGLNQ
jgi:hypothetical protein